MSEHAAAAPPIKLPMDAVAIRKILPHRYPFLLIDRVIALDHAAGTITAIKCVTQNEPFFQGHFPQIPIMPGVLQIEALAQTGAVLLLTSAAGMGKLAVLTSVDDFKFRRPVVPGDQLTISVYDLKFRRGFGRALGNITVEGEMTCSGSIGFALIDAPQGE